MNETEKQQLVELLEWKTQMESANTIPLRVDQALSGRGFTKIGLLTGILRSIGGVLSAIIGKSGTNTYYVASVSGGSPTTAVTFREGVHTS